MIMRHIYIRWTLGVIWIAAAIISGVSGSLEWQGFICF